MRLRPPRAFWVAADWLAAAFCWVVIFGVLFSRSNGPHGVMQLLSVPSLLAALLAFGLAAPVAFRRRAPGRALAIVLALWVVTLATGAEITRGPFLPLAFVLYLVACTSRRPVAAAGLAVTLLLLGAQGTAMHFSGAGSGNAVAVGLLLTIVWVVGYSVQQRRSYMAQVRERAASDAVTRERLRIARELHDVVAHSMTVVTVQAGYGEYVFDSQPGEARAALGAIQSVSREALGEMQRLLSVLRQTSAEAAGETTLATGTAPAGASPLAGGRASGAVPAATTPAAVTPAAGTPPTVTPAAVTTAAGTPATSASAARVFAAGAGTPPALAAAGGGPDGGGGTGTPWNREAPPLAPAPGLAGLDRLVERTAGAGVQVTVERTGAARSVPASIDLSAYRIVQEALTNVVKHSGAGCCHVLVGYAPDALLVQVTDGGPGGAAPSRAAVVPRQAVVPRAGHGLMGMRERVSLCGGDFSAGPRPDAGFRVRARLPLPAAAR
jgi:signal transduction histidine kinase